MADGYRDYGPGVSESPNPLSSGGAFSGDDRSYESVVIQADAPVIDWEMNLRSQISSDYGLRRAAQRLMASCWLGGDFLERSGPTGSFSFPSASPGNQNLVYLLSDHALINGWILNVDFTGVGSSGMNAVVLPSPPSSGTRADLVVLEVWRALLTAAPSTSNKSPTGLILRNGNVRAPDSVNLADDLIDSDYGSESNARVQIQYRLRVIPGVNIASYPDGIDDPSVVANSASNFSGPGADGAPTAYGYSVSPGDKGLWVAGTGDPTSSAALGTVDGLMYAQPVAAVLRRNSSAFSRSSNMNGGGLIASGVSGRPDGLYADQVTPSDIVDLRRFCSSGYEEIMEKAFQQVLDNTMCTRGGASVQGASGTAFLFRDDIGSSGPPGNTDGIRRYFGDRGVTDSIVAIHDAGGLPETNIVFRLSSLQLPWNASPVDVLSSAPAGTNIAFLSGLRIVSSAGDFDALDAASPQHAVKVVFSTTVSGVDTMTVTLNTSVTNVRVCAELALEYPPSFGLSRNVIGGIALWASPSGVPAWMDTSSWQATSDGTRLSIPDSPSTAYDGSQQWVDPGHREQAIRHRTVLVSATVYAVQVPAEIVGSNTSGFANTSTNSVLRVRDNPLSSFSSFSVTSGASVPKTTIRDDMNSQFTSLLLDLVASVVGIDQIKIVSNSGYVGIDSVANGSTLNSAVGFSAAGQSSGASAIMIPERLTGDPLTVNDGSNAYSTTSYTVNTAYTTVQLTYPVSSASPVSVQYYAYRPPPPVLSGNAYNAFYGSAFVQSLLPPAGNQTLRLVPRAVGKAMSVIATGPGSPDSSFPYSSPGDQVAVGSTPSPDFPDSLLDGPTDVQLQNFGINTGFLQLAPFVPYSPSPGMVTLYRSGSDTVTDAEGRNFWPKSDSGSPSVYSPTVYAQELSYGRRHKTAYPVLMELKEDYPSVGQKGMLVLVVFSSWSSYDPYNEIVLTQTAGDSAAAVYRVRGNALSPRRPAY